MKNLLKKLNNKKVLIVLIFLLSFSVYLIDLDKPHELWDERARYVAGLNQWFNVLNGKFDSESWMLNFQHPPMGKYLYGLVNGVYIFSTNTKILSLSYDDAILLVDQVKNFLPGRLLAIFLASISIVITYLIGEEFFNRKVGVLAALFLFLMPAFISNVKIESLEAPLIFFFLLTMYTFLKALKTGGNNNYYILSGIFAGFAIATKFNNLILYILLPVIYFIFLFLKREKISIQKIIPTKFLIAAIIPIAILFLIWPWLWSNPMNNFQQSLSFWTYSNQEYFLGNLIVPSYDYYVVYFFATMPILFIIFFLLSMKQLNSKNVYVKLLFIWFFVSLLIFSFLDFKQNGPRYVISIYPAFAILTAIGFLQASEFFKRINTKIPLIFLILTLIYSSFVVASIHPYYLDYYNELTDGPAVVYKLKLFNIGWQGEGIDEAVNYLNENAETNSTIEFHVVPSHTTHKLRKDLTEVNPVAKDNMLRLSEIEIDQELHNADYVVVNTYFEWYINQSYVSLLFQPENFYDIIKIADVQDAPLVKIYRKI